MGYLIFIFLVLLILLILLYNRFVRLENMVKEAWSDVDVQLKRRYDLIPNFVTIVKDYMKYETQTLKEIVSARNIALHQMSPDQKENSENQIADKLRHLFAVAEQYPKLKSDKQFKELSNTLIEIENTLQSARRYYNATVRNYNIALHSIPSNLLALFLHLSDKPYFEITDFETKNIQVVLDEK